MTGKETHNSNKFHTLVQCWTMSLSSTIVVFNPFKSQLLGTNERYIINPCPATPGYIRFQVDYKPNNVTENG